MEIGNFRTIQVVPAEHPDGQLSQDTTQNMLVAPPSPDSMELARRILKSDPGQEQSYETSVLIFADKLDADSCLRGVMENIIVKDNE